MYRWTSLILAALMCALIAMGCSGSGGGVSPFAPTTDNGTTAGNPHEGQTQTHLWGYYDVYIDVATQTAEAVVNRTAMFDANVVTFLNNNPAGLSFHINGTPSIPGGVEVDIDVSITHPLSGLPQYDGYDVLGVFCANGSKTMAYNADLKYAGYMTDQTLDNADGYTRWFNATEFDVPGLFGYKPGLVGSKGYTPTATLNPYKYFADGLTAAGDAWTFLNTTPESHHGAFFSGSTNTRNYQLTFPIPTPGVKFAYAVVANWKGELAADHPCNATEAPSANVEINPNVYYTDPTHNGGDLILDISPFGWAFQPSTIFVESTVLTAPYELTTEMTPTGGTPNYSTYHVEIPADHVTSTGGQEYWVVCQYDGFDYTNSFGVPNDAGTDKLAAFFRYNLDVAAVQYNQAPVVTSGVTGDAAPIINSAVKTYTVVATDADLDTLYYYWTVTDEATGLPVPGYDGFPGGSSGTFDILWDSISTDPGAEYTVSCMVDDGIDDAVPQPIPLLVTITCPSPMATAVVPASGAMMTTVNVTVTLDGGLLNMSLGNIKTELTDGTHSILGTLPVFVDSTHLTDRYVIPGTAFAGPYKIKVTNDCGSVTTSTANLFTILTPLVTVTNPNGGNCMDPYQTQTIQWTSANLGTSLINIRFSSDNGSNWSTIFTGTANDGTENWTPTTSHTSGTNYTCLIQVVAAGITGIFDNSNSGFRVSNPSILVTNPNTPVSWAVGSSQTLTWTETGWCSPFVQIDISRDSGSNWTNITNGYYYGSYGWTVTGPAGTQNRIRVRGYYTTTASDMSDVDFTITDPFKKLSIDASADALDIAIRPDNANYNVYVLYADATVRIYTMASNYASYSGPYTVLSGAKYIDVNQTGYFVVGYSSGTWVYLNSYYPTGGLVYANSVQPSASYNAVLCDVSQDQYSGTYYNDHCMAYYYSDGSTAYGTYRVYLPSTFTTTQTMTTSCPLAQDYNWNGYNTKAIDSGLGYSGYRSFYQLRNTWSSSYMWASAYYDQNTYGNTSVYNMGWQGWYNSASYQPYARLGAPVDITAGYGITGTYTVFVLDNDTLSGGPGWCIKRAGQSLNTSSMYPPITLNAGLITGIPLRFDHSGQNGYNTTQRMAMLTRNGTVDYVSVFFGSEL